MRDKQATDSSEDLWGRRVADYEAMFAPFSTAVAKAGLHELDQHGMVLETGVRFLDIAAGTGALTLEVATTGAAVTAIDSSEGMLGLLRRKLPGGSGVEVLVMDGTELEFEDQQFDLAGSNLGIAVFPNPKKGLREMRRVLRDGGHALVTAVASPTESALMQTILRALDAVLPKERPVTTAPPDPLDSSGGLCEALEEAGFRNVGVATRTLPWKITDAREFWLRWGTTAPPVAPLFNGLPPNVLSAAGIEFERLLSNSPTDGQSVFETDVLIGVGTR